MLTDVTIWFALGNSDINFNTSLFHIQKSPRLNDTFYNLSNSEIYLTRKLEKSKSKTLNGYRGFNKLF